jgi:hypothetical protein
MAMTRQCDKCGAVPAQPVTVSPEATAPWTIDLCDGCLKAVRPGGKAGRTYGFRKTPLPAQPQ